MIISNKNILERIHVIEEAFSNETKTFPVFFNYIFQKNVNILLEAAMEIEQSRMAIGQKYGEYDSEQNGYTIPEENIKLAHEEYDQLMDILQELNTISIKLEKIKDIEFTLPQMNAIMFMIEEE